MQAIRVHRFGGPEVLTLEQVPDPLPDPGEVLVEVHAAGVNPADTYVRSGAYSRLPGLPYTPGWDGAGVVPATGARVYFSGTTAGRGLGAYAELVISREDQVHPLPDRLSFAQGAAIGVPYATAWRALDRAQARPGETLLVHGASGGTGLATAQLGRARGLKVIGTAGSAEGLDLLRAQGVDHAVRHGVAGTVEEVLALTGGRGVDVIVEMLANANLDRDLAMLAPNGRVAIVGNRGRVEIDPRQAMAREATIVGVMLWLATDEELAAIHRGLGPGLADGTITPVVGKEIALAEAARAHEAVMSPGARGKVVLRIRSPGPR
jgi:NADPH2:quinone reductase